MNFMFNFFLKDKSFTLFYQLLINSKGLNIIYPTYIENKLLKLRRIQRKKLTYQFEKDLNPEFSVISSGAK